MQDLNISTKIEVLDASENPRTKAQFGRFSIEPLESGWGITIGNALRRVLLSSVEGAAVTAVQIDGVIHEFSSLPGMREDIADFMLNVKGIVLRSHSNEEETLVLNKEGAASSEESCIVNAGDIEENSNVEIINPDLYLAELNDTGTLRARLFVNKGKGYQEAQELAHRDYNIIPIDAIFTPVKKVNYHVLDTRVGQYTNFDKLVMEIWTNGALLPQEALKRAFTYLVTEFQYLRDLFEERTEEKSVVEDAVDNEDVAEEKEIPIEELELSVRAYNCLKRARINTLGELLQIIDSRSEDLKKIKNLGQKTYEEIVEKVTKMGYQLDKIEEKEVNRE